MIFHENGYAYDETTARQLLLDSGFDAFDVEELSTLIAGDKIAKLEQEAHGGDNYELIADGYFCQINTALGKIEKYLEADRITNAREKFEEIQNILENY